MPTIIKKEGFPYAFDPDECANCGGRCCTGESGNIFVNSGEIRAIASVLKLDAEVFKSGYLIKKGYRYSLREKVVGVSHDCIFYDREHNGCKIYLARPMQCQTFPFWDYYKERVDELKVECPGIIDA
ncbi:MAG: YkgJ family cysteine cluster protein [Campylobacterota bacterium]|nr:YkgJ family cysteine cluster protein [Campylobacterota bacterium]